MASSAQTHPDRSTTERTSLDDIMESVASDTIPHIHNPTPDLQTLQGAYVQNIERLEEHAERMSVGSDLAEEIRKLKFEQKQSDSRRSSLQSVVLQEDLNRSRSRRASHQQRSRNVSTSSYANSIVDVNKEARYGGYSPAGYINIGSPRGSMHSQSWSQVSYIGSGSMSRSRSATKGLRPMQTNHVFHDTSLVNSPIEEPFGDEFEGINRVASVPMSIPQRMPSDGSYHKLYDQIIEANGSQTHASSLRLPSRGSFSDIYEEIAAGIKKELHNASNPQLAAEDGQSEFKTVEDHQTRAGQGPVVPYLESQEVTHEEEDVEDSILHPSELGGRLQVRNVENETYKPLPQIPTLGEAIQFDSGAIEVGDRTSRPISAASGDTYRQAQHLFHDFDGAHAAPSIRESMLDASGMGDSRPNSVLHQMQPTVQPRYPPPGDGMVYYPAPVPRQLNLPQRLSQLPPAHVQDQRRSQMLNTMSHNARKSAIWLNGDVQTPSPPQLQRNRSSMLGLAGTLPDQLRATMFFENPGGSEEVRIHEGGALATLDDLLDASALAPVAAFTHHPYAGEEGAKIYKKDPRSRESVSTTRISGSPAKTPARPIFASPQKSIGVRAASFMGFAGGKSPATPGRDDDDNDLDLAGQSSARKKVTRKSSASLLEIPGSNRNPLSRSSSSPSTLLRQNSIEEEEDAEAGAHDDEEGSADEDDEIEEGLIEDEEPEPEYNGPPTTLLAELQYRKAHQKTRNLTAATAFPNGMHSTLLELDAVHQLEKAKRKKTRVALAWEDPQVHKALEEPTDDDVPLGVLFAKQTKAGLPEANRPIGLLERKALEDNEPLSNRRNRILGIEPPPRSPMKSDFNAPQIEINGAEESEEDPTEGGETLAQRVRRLRTKKELDSALSSVADDRPFSEAFSTELFADIDPKKEQEKRLEASASAPAPEPAEETLGQRRARLQREKDAAGGSGALPTLKHSSSMADLLSAFPSGDAGGKRGPLSPTDRGLLQKSEESRATKKQALRDVNLRSASYGTEGGLDRPLVDVSPSGRPGMSDRRKSGGFANGIYNNGTGGEGMNPADAVDRNAINSSGNAMGMGAGNGFVAGPTASPYATMAQQPMASPYGMYGQNMSMPYLGMPQQQQMYMNQMMAAQASMMSLQDPNMMAMQNPYMMGMQQIPMYGMPMQQQQQPPPLMRNQTGLTNNSAAKRASMSSVNLLQNMGGALHAGRQMPMNMNMYNGMGVPMMGPNRGGAPVMPMGFDMAAPLDNKQRDRIDAWRQGVTGMP